MQYAWEATIKWEVYKAVELKKKVFVCSPGYLIMKFERNKSSYLSMIVNAEDYLLILPEFATYRSLYTQINFYC